MAEIKLNINWDDLHQQIGKLVSSGAGMAAGAAGAAGGGGGANVAGALGRGLVGPAGARTETVGKGLGQIAKQLPGIGMFGDMAKAFTTGGLIGVGMAGIAGILSFMKQIMESSKVFQGIAGSFFKIFGAMADVFLLPFLPIAMKGMQVLLKYIPNFGEWGKTAADGIDKLISIFADKGFFGGIKQIVKNAWGFIKDKALPFMTDNVIPLIDQAAVDITKEIGKQLFGIGKEEEPYEEAMFDEGGDIRPEYSATGGGYGGGGKQYRKAMKREYGSQWNRERDLNPDYINEMQLGGEVSGIHRAGAAGGRSIGSGFNPEMGNPLRNIRGKSMDIIKGVGEDVLQLEKNASAYVDTSERDFNDMSSGFLGGIRDSMLGATSNITIMQNKITERVKEVDKIRCEVDVMLANVKQVAKQTITTVGDNFNKEVTALQTLAELQKRKIVEGGINFEKMAGGWSGDEFEDGTLSSADLKMLAEQVQAKLDQRLALEKELERQRIKAEEDRIKAEVAHHLALKVERERLQELERQKIKEDQEEKDRIAAEKAEEFRINTLTETPMFQNFARMQTKLDQIKRKLESQEAAKAGLYANAETARLGMTAYVDQDKEADYYLKSRRRQQYWTSVVMPAQDAAQRHIESMGQTRQDIQNIENWIRTKQIPSIYYNYLGQRLEENKDNIASHMRSNLNYDAGGIVEGDIGEPQLIWAQGGEQISPIGMPKNNGGGNTSNRVLNISIETKSSVKDILIDLANLKTLDDASLFNSIW